MEGTSILLGSVVMLTTTITLLLLCLRFKGKQKLEKPDLIDVTTGDDVGGRTVEDVEPIPEMTEEDEYEFDLGMRARRSAPSIKLFRDDGPLESHSDPIHVLYKKVLPRDQRTSSISVASSKDFGGSSVASSKDYGTAKRLQPPLPKRSYLHSESWRDGSFSIALSDYGDEDDDGDGDDRDENIASSGKTEFETKKDELSEAHRRATLALRETERQRNEQMDEEDLFATIEEFKQPLPKPQVLNPPLSLSRSASSQKRRSSRSSEHRNSELRHQIGHGSGRRRRSSKNLSASSWSSINRKTSSLPNNEIPDEIIDPWIINAHYKVSEC